MTCPGSTMCFSRFMPFLCRKHKNTLFRLAIDEIGWQSIGCCIIYEVRLILESVTTLKTGRFMGFLKNTLEKWSKWSNISQTNLEMPNVAHLTSWRDGFCAKKALQTLVFEQTPRVLTITHRSPWHSLPGGSWKMCIRLQTTELRHFNMSWFCASASYFP